jgi:type IV secretory pathway TrbF-like protein
MPRPVLIVFATLAGMQVLTAGSVLAEVTDPKMAAFAALVVAAAQTGLAVYVQGQVTPWVSVAAQRDTQGRVRTGPAATDVLAGNANVGEPAVVEVKPPTIAEGL